ncbi:NADPH-dependent diflavin oxidoreductase 1 isoform X2 [Cylas formicarius]|uniref:NADPH-dependent diflavin oxidoreductase 1 isoform X2 n=1 Tax=Cylas formicarius TaxID=197179 RepID=UPI00295891C1|nr:NADPH-dependent diflavin oxidoreductase 1 isoform X2 [Cylas formicarius]
MDFENQRLALLYGSQTGNAQDLTERLYRESKRFYFGSVVKSLDQYNVIDLVKEQCAIFICSTTGQGEEPDNMKHFWKFLLRKSLPSNSLCSLKFAVLGLGDSSYPKFNFVAKRLHKRLLQLGGQSIIPLGLGDDQHDLGYDAVADLWFQQLFSQLLQLYPLPNGVSPLPKNLNIKSRWNVFIRDSKNFDDHRNILCKTQSIYYSTSQSGDFTSKVIANERITDVAHFQDIRLLKLQSKGKKYCPGDVLVLRPRNLSWKIKEFKEILSTNNIHISDDTVFQIIEKSTDIPVPEIFKSEVTFQQLCEEYFDLFSIPRRSVFKILAQLTDSELEKEKCLEFCAAEGQQEMYSYVHRPRRNIVEILQDFPHATKNLTPDMLFEILPPIKAREFSIASSFAIHKNEIHLLVAVVKYKTKLMKERLGLCSNYLADLKPGDDVTIWIKKGCFKFPQHLDSPVIMTK